MSLIRIKVKIDIPFDAWIDDIEAVLAEGMRDLMIKASNEWKDAAARKLRTTKRAYQEAIQTKVIDDKTVHIFLSHNDQRKNWLVNAIELGHGPMLPWKSTLAGRKSFYWSPQARWPGKYKWHSYAAGYQGRTKARVPPGGYKPFMDVPQWGKQGAIEGGRPSGKDAFRRLTAANSSRWTHPGFKPVGKGGLDKPLREDVIAMICSEAPQMFKRLIEQVLRV